MKSGYLAGVMEMVMGAVVSAEKKHPRFASRYLADVSREGAVEARRMLEGFQKENDRREHSGGGVAESLFLEEFMEADVAYREGNYVQCLRELSHCAAVVIRMMLMARGKIRD